MIDWEKGHIDRKRKRNREKLGLPAEDYENNNLRVSIYFLAKTYPPSFN